MSAKFCLPFGFVQQQGIQCRLDQVVRWFYPQKYCHKVQITEHQHGCNHLVTCRSNYQTPN